MLSYIDCINTNAPVLIEFTSFNQPRQSQMGHC